MVNSYVPNCCSSSQQLSFVVLLPFPLLCTLKQRPLFGLNYLPYNFCFCFQPVFTAPSCQKSHILNNAVGHTLKPHEIPGFLAARHKLAITLGQNLSSYTAWGKFTDIVKMYPFVLFFNTTSEKQSPISIPWQFYLHFWRHLDDKLQIECIQKTAGERWGAQTSFKRIFMSDHFTRISSFTFLKSEATHTTMHRQFAHTAVCKPSVFTFAS